MVKQNDKMAVYVCKDAAAALRAKSYLKTKGYPPQRMIVEKSARFNYDGQTYSGGGTFDSNKRNKYIVIARK